MTNNWCDNLPILVTSTGYRPQWLLNRVQLESISSPVFYANSFDELLVQLLPQPISQGGSLLHLYVRARETAIDLLVLVYKVFKLWLLGKLPLPTLRYIQYCAYKIPYHQG